MENSENGSNLNPINPQEPVRLYVSKPEDALKFLSLTLFSEKVSLTGRDFILCQEAFGTLTNLLDEIKISSKEK